MFGMLWFAVVTLSLLLQISTVISRSCFYCHSQNSWEDCGIKAKNASCTAGNTCLMFHRKITQHNGKELQEFMKACYPTSLCTLNECYRADKGKVTWCDLRCCSTNLCNKERIQVVKPSGTNSAQTKGPTHPQGYTGSPSKYEPVNAAKNSRPRNRNSTKPKAVQTIAPRAGISTVIPLSCSYCYSQKSWEDCSIKAKKTPCSAGNTCLMFYRKITQHNGKELQEFVKTCYPTSLCTLRECYRTDKGKVTWCGLNCCNTSLCNKEIPKQMSKSAEGFPPRKRKLSNSTKRKAVQTIVPRDGHQRKSSKKILGSSFYVTVSMVAISLVVARQHY